MFRRMPQLVTLLVAAMLIGLVGHGVELFYPVEGGGFYGFIKALGFPLAFECGNAVGLYVGFNHRTRGGWTRFVALLIGLACLVTSYIVQHHYFHQRIEWDWWYAGVLPGLVALLSALAGLLDHEQNKTAAATAQTPPQAVPAPQISSNEIRELEVRFSELQQSLREIAAAVRIIQEPQTNHTEAARPQVATEFQAAPVAAFTANMPTQSREPQDVLAEKVRLVTIGAGAADGAAEIPFHSPQSERVSLTTLLGEELLAGEEFTSSEIAVTQIAQSLTFDGPPKMSDPNVDFSRLTAQERDEWCYHLRVSGWNYLEIGKLIGKSQDSAGRYAKAYAERHGLPIK